jgi:DNA topoisomerase-1
MANLVIVESPAKANTIKGYLGSGYKVVASKGHIRDLPKSSLGIDIDNGFEPKYINIRGKGDVVSLLRKEAKSANKIYLATDPDREGEAISWHIATQLGIPEDKECRITFNEITKSAVKDAIKHPRKINRDLVNSQQARRILDRLVGFKLSEVLWKNVKSGLSAGRVQSVATRIIAEKEAEIKSFVPQEFWTVDAKLKTLEGESITVRFFGDTHKKIRISSENEAASVILALDTDKFFVKSVKHIQKNRMPAPPFTTSTMQQEASKKLGFQTQRIMKIAQELYDGLNIGTENGGFQGLITYMRTDSTRIAKSAKEMAESYILENYGKAALPTAKRYYKTGENSQDAHEAIRPSNVYLEPQKIKKYLSLEQYKLYKLIWERFVASQMQNAVIDTVTVDIQNGKYIFKTGGYMVKSRGYMAVYDNLDEQGEDGENLSKFPSVKDGDKLFVQDVSKEQHFTEPPPRYTEASLIKFLEENGIGRPSTYAPIISIIISREYVKRDGKALASTQLGEITTEFMKKNFPSIVDYEFTASMEDKLDSIENGNVSSEKVLSEFYDGFKSALEKSKGLKHVDISSTYEESDVVCDKCGAKMVYKSGRFGKFLACPSYPECKNTLPLDKNGNIATKREVKVELAGFKCELCGSEMLVRNGAYGTFYACQNYPKCRFTKQKQTELSAKCPICSSRILVRHGRKNSLFYSCENYPKCDFSSWDMPLGEKCPDCGAPLYYRKSQKSAICKNKGCSFKREQDMPVIE